MSTSFTPEITARVCRELRQLSTNPPDGVRFDAEASENLNEVYAVIFGPGFSYY